MCVSGGLAAISMLSSDRSDVTSANTLAATAVAMLSSSLAATRKLKKLSLPARLQQHRRSIPEMIWTKNEYLLYRGCSLRVQLT